MPLTIRKATIPTQRGEEERLVAYTQNGNSFGVIARDSEKDVAEGPIQLGFSIAKDGNLRAVWQPLGHENEE